MQQRHQLQLQTVARLQCCQSRSLTGAQGVGSQVRVVSSLGQG